MQNTERACNSKKIGLSSSINKKVNPKLRITTQFFGLPERFSFAKKEGKLVFFK